MNRTICFFIVLLFVVTSTASPKTNYRYHILLNNLLLSLESLLTYYSDHIYEFNVDGIFGLKVLESEVNILLNDMDGNLINMLETYSDLDRFVGASDSPINRIRNIQDKSRVLVIKAIDQFKSNNDEYLRKFQYLLVNDWRPNLYSRSIYNHDSTDKEIHEFKFDESESDKCLSEILNLMDTDRSAEQCNISLNCQNIFLTQKPYSHYYLTHQLLYFILAHKSSCDSHIDNLLRRHDKSLDTLEQEICSKIYREQQALIHQIDSNYLTVKPQYQDLFMEQNFLCGSIGFYKFMNLRYIPMMISWQSSSGCYRLYPDGNRASTKSRNILQYRFRRKQLFMERKISDGCLSHKTSLGAAALSTYLKVFYNKNLFPNSNSIFKAFLDERNNYQKRFLPPIENDRPGADNEEVDVFSHNILYIETANYSGNLSLWVPYFVPVLNASSNNVSDSPEINYRSKIPNNVYDNKLSQSYQANLPSINLLSIIAGYFQLKYQIITLLLLIVWYSCRKRYFNRIIKYITNS